MNPERNDNASKWKSVIATLLSQIRDGDEIARLDELRLRMLRSVDGPTAAEEWREAIDDALALANQGVLDFVLRSCKKSDLKLSFLYIGASQFETVDTRQLWQCVAELEIEKVTLHEVECFTPEIDFITSPTLHTLIFKSCTVASDSVFTEISRFSGLRCLQIVDTKMQGFQPFPDLARLLPKVEELLFFPASPPLWPPVLALGAQSCFHPDFARSLTTHKSLRNLALRDLPCDKLVLLLQAAAKNARLEVLAVRFTVLGEAEVERATAVCRELATAIAANSSLREVGLLIKYDGQLDDDVRLAEPVVEAVGALKRIDTFTLDCPHYPNLLKPLIKQRALKKLDLRSRQNDDQRYSISRETFNDLIALLDSLTTTLQRLALPSYAGYVDNGEAVRLIEAIGKAKALQGLDLRGVAMNWVVLNDLLNKSITNPKIKHLDYDLSEEVHPDSLLLQNNASLITLGMHPEPEISHYFAPDLDLEFHDDFAALRHLARLVTRYNIKATSTEIQNLIRQAIHAFSFAKGIPPDLGKLIGDDRALADFAGFKTLVQMREVNRNAAGLPFNSPWKAKLNEIVNKSHPAVIRLARQGVDCRPLLAERPDDQDKKAWRALFGAAICLPEPELLNHLLNITRPPVNELFIGNSSPLATLGRISLNPKSVRKALEVLQAHKLAISCAELSASWFRQLDYFQSADKLNTLCFDRCSSSDEPFAELIGKLKCNTLVSLFFTTMGILPSQEIFEAIGKNEKIGALRYEGPQLQKNCLKHLSANKKLHTLHLDGRLLVVACAELAALLTANSSLTSLKLRACEFDDQRLATLAEAFKNSKVLQTLDLTNNYFSVEQEKMLIGALKASRSIKKIIPWNIFWDNESRKKYTALFGDRMELPREDRGTGQSLALMDS